MLFGEDSRVAGRFQNGMRMADNLANIDTVRILDGPSAVPE